MSDALVQVDDSRDAIAVLTLNRPDKRNALNIALMQALCEALESLNRDASTRVAIIQGAGPVFCAGLDLQEAQDPGNAAESAELVAKLLLTVHRMSAVTIAAVHGGAIAGGAGLMSACDFVIATESTRIGYPEVRRGLVAGLVMTFLRRQLSDRDARELLLLGELVDAHRAQEMGLVNRVVPEGTALEGAVGMARVVLKGAPGAITRSRKLLEELWPHTVEDDLRRALDYHKRARGSAEALEGMSAFTEKRLPDWDPDAEG